MQITPEVLAQTRESLHRLAEHVVSPSRWAVTGRIGLRPHPGGLTTPAFGPVNTVVAVELGELVVRTPAEDRRLPVTTIREAAAFLGVTPGAPASVYTPATPCDLDAPLVLDPRAMRVLADWYLLGAAALDAVAVALAAEEPTEAQLWPEHLDLAIAAGGVNYGFSPGDAAIDEPYAYIGPHDGPPTRDDFWNAPFGAVRRSSELTSVAAALEFLLEGHARLTPATTSEGSST